MTTTVNGSLGCYFWRRCWFFACNMRPPKPAICFSSWPPGYALQHLWTELRTLLSLSLVKVAWRQKERLKELAHKFWNIMLRSLFEILRRKKKKGFPQKAKVICKNDDKKQWQNWKLIMLLKHEHSSIVVEERCKNGSPLVQKTSWWRIFASNAPGKLSYNIALLPQLCQ